MKSARLAKELGYTFDGGVFSPRGRWALPYRDKVGGDAKFAFKHDGAIHVVKVREFAALFREKSPNLVTSESKSKRHSEIVKFYLKNRSYKYTMARFGISKGGLFLILQRLKTFKES